MKKACVLLIPFLCLAIPLLADGTTPPKKESSAKEEMRKDFYAAKKAANDALWAVDRGVHKVINSFNKSGSKNCK